MTSNARWLWLGCNLVAALSLVACIDPGGDESEADADAMGGGKADELGLPFGPYTAFDPSGATDKMPLVAVFHPPDGSEPAGDHGQFDLARQKGDYDSTYHAGTFKLYTWQGRNRIRFSTYDGRVIQRSDWSKDGNGIELAGMGMYQGNRLPEELVDCVAVDILDSNVFEEGLSVNEYPDVSVDKAGADKFDLDIGASSIDHEEATVTVTTSARDFEARGKTDEGTYIVRVPLAAPRRGEVLFQPTGEAESSIATIVCRP